MLVLVSVVFLGPLLAAFFLYFTGIWQPADSTENGLLLTPTQLSDTPLLAEEDSPQLRKLWSIVYVGEGSCADACRTALYESRQVRKALGKESSRIQRVYVVTDGEPDMSFIGSEHPGLIVVTAGPGKQEILDAVGQTEPGDIFLVDPAGNLMMRFPEDIGMRGMKDDLKHLLKVSRIG